LLEAFAAHELAALKKENERLATGNRRLSEDFQAWLKKYAAEKEELADAKERIANFEEESDQNDNLFADLNKLIRSQAEELAVARTALRKYGDHLSSCLLPYGLDRDCTCGFIAASGGQREPGE